MADDRTPETNPFQRAFQDGDYKPLEALFAQMSESLLMIAQRVGADQSPAEAPQTAVEPEEDEQLGLPPSQEEEQSRLRAEAEAQERIQQETAARQAAMQNARELMQRRRAEKEAQLQLEARREDTLELVLGLVGSGGSLPDLAQQLLDGDDLDAEQLDELDAALASGHEPAAAEPDISIDEPQHEPDVEDSPQPVEPVAEQTSTPDEAPADPEPVAEAPVVPEPVVAAPAAPKPVAAAPAAHDAPVAPEPDPVDLDDAFAPLSEQPVAETPALQSPQPVSNSFESALSGLDEVDLAPPTQPVTEQPVTEQPVTEQPVTEQLPSAFENSWEDLDDAPAEDVSIADDLWDAVDEPEAPVAEDDPWAVAPTAATPAEPTDDPWALPAVPDQPVADAWAPPAASAADPDDPWALPAEPDQPMQADEDAWVDPVPAPVADAWGDEPSGEPWAAPAEPVSDAWDPQPSTGSNLPIEPLTPPAADNWRAPAMDMDDLDPSLFAPAETPVDEPLDVQVEPVQAQPVQAQPVQAGPVAEQPPADDFTMWDGPEPADSDGWETGPVPSDPLPVQPSAAPAFDVNADPFADDDHETHEVAVRPSQDVDMPQLRAVDLIWLAASPEHQEDEAEADQRVMEDIVSGALNEAARDDVGRKHKRNVKSMQFSKLREREPLVVVFASPKGGTGKSSQALNFAAAVADTGAVMAAEDRSGRMHTPNVLLIDGDIGDGSLSVRVIGKPPKHRVGAGSRNPETGEYEPDEIPSLLSLMNYIDDKIEDGYHDEPASFDNPPPGSLSMRDFVLARDTIPNLHVLAAPDDPDFVGDMEKDEYRDLMRRFGRFYDVIVIDAGTEMWAHYNQVWYESAHAIFVMMSPDLATLNGCRKFVKYTTRGREATKRTQKKLPMTNKSKLQLVMLNAFASAADVRINPRETAKRLFQWARPEQMHNFDNRKQDMDRANNTQEFLVLQDNEYASEISRLMQAAFDSYV